MAMKNREKLVTVDPWNALKEGPCEAKIDHNFDLT